MRRSLTAFSALPISSRRREPRMSLSPPKETRPFRKMRLTASVVSCCIRCISDKSLDGTSARQRSRRPAQASRSRQVASCSIDVKMEKRIFMNCHENGVQSGVSSPVILRTLSGNFFKHGKEIAAIIESYSLCNPRSLLRSSGKQLSSFCNPVPI